MPAKSLKHASAALIGSFVFVALLLVALPKPGEPTGDAELSPQAASKTQRPRPLKQAPAPVPAPAPQVTASVGPPVDPEVALEEVLTKSDSTSATARQEMAERIVAIGPKALPLIVGKVCGTQSDEEPAQGDAQPSERPEGEGNPQLDELRDGALHDAIAKFDPAQQLACIVEQANGASLDKRLVLAGLLGEVDHPDAVRELIALVRPLEPIQWQRDYVRNPVEQALSRRFTAHPETLTALRPRLKDEQLELVAVIADACTRQPTCASVDLALSLLDRSPELDRDVLRSLAHLNRAAPLAIEEARLERVRQKLTDADPEIRRAAAAVTGALHDFDAVEELVAALGDTDPSVAGTVHWSLSAMVRLDRGSDVPAWNAWLTERARWHTEDAPELLAQLASEDAGEVVKALGALLAEPQDRRGLADAITPLLASEDPAIFRAACSALGTLGSARPLPELVSALSSKDTKRRDVAAASLRTLTGLDLPAKAAPWATALGR